MPSPAVTALALYGENAASPAQVPLRRGRRDSSQRPFHAPIPERHRASVVPAVTYGRGRRPRTLDGENVASPDAPPPAVSTRGRRDSSQRAVHAPISERHRGSVDPAVMYGRGRRPRTLDGETGAPSHRTQLQQAASAAWVGAGEGIRTLDVHLGKVALYR
jgi:hypothetical protein